MVGYRRDIKRSLLLTGLVGSLLPACYNGDELPLFESRKDPQTRGGQVLSPSEPYQDRNLSFGSGSADLLDTSLGNQAYPLLNLRGDGTLNHSQGTANVEQSMTAHVTADQLEFNVMSFRATGGSRVSEVNNAINSKTGPSRGKRSDRDKARSLGSNYQSFIIYADDITDQEGNSFTFTTPLPVFVIPASKSRYDQMPPMGLTLTTQVTGSESFTVTTTVRRISATTDPHIRILVNHSIPNDNRGRQYGRFPLARESEFVIDPERQILREIRVRRTYHSDRSNDARDIRLNYRVCSAVQNGRTEQIMGC